MKVIRLFCEVCKKKQTMRVVLSGQFWLIVTCPKCKENYRCEKDMPIIEHE